MNSQLQTALPLLVAIVSGPLVWGLLQHVLTRRRANAEEERKQHEHEQQVEAERVEAERLSRERRELLTAAQETAQRIALQSADERYGALHTDYESCRTALTECRDASWLLIEMLEGWMSRMQSQENGGGEKVYAIPLSLHEVGEARRKINEARRRLR
jgi:hypothetical protein